MLKSCGYFCPPPASPHCPKDCVYHEESSRCFQIFPGELSWTDARQQCSDHGGDLAIVRSDALRNRLAERVKQWVFLFVWGAETGTAIFLCVCTLSREKVNISFSFLLYNSIKNVWAEETRLLLKPATGQMTRQIYCTVYENSVTSLFAARRPVCLQQPQPNKHSDRHQILETNAELSNTKILFGERKGCFFYHHHHRWRCAFVHCLFSHFLNVQNCPPRTQRVYRCVQITMSNLLSAHGLTHTVFVLYEVCVQAG